MNSQTLSTRNRPPKNAPVAQAITSQHLPQLYRRRRVRAMVRSVSPSTTSALFRYSQR